GERLGALAPVEAERVDAAGRDGKRQMRDVIETLLLEGRALADDGMDLVGGGDGGQKLATGRAGHLCRGERGGEVVGRVEALAPDHEDVNKSGEGAGEPVVEAGGVG